MIGSWGGRASRRSPASMVAVWSMIAIAAAAASVAAASLTLDEAQTREALRVGAGSVTLGVTLESFRAEWRVTDGKGDTVVVVTPFHRLAMAARNAAFKDEDVGPRDLTKLLRAERDRLEIWATLRGAREDFARRLRPELSAGDRVIKAAFVQNEHTPARSGDGGYVARCVWWFPTKELSGTSRLSLVVRDADGREVNAFTIDLSRMR